MNSKKQNNTATATEFELDTSIIEGIEKGYITVLFKHDYYSSDSDHGRSLLKGFIKVIRESLPKINRIILIDSGVKLLSEENPFYEDMVYFANNVPSFLVCFESMTEYNIKTTALPMISYVSSYDSAIEIFDQVRLITIQ